MTIDRVALDIRDAVGAQVQGSLNVTFTAAQRPPVSVLVSLPATPGALPVLPPRNHGSRFHSHARRLHPDLRAPLLRSS